LKLRLPHLKPHRHLPPKLRPLLLLPTPPLRLLRLLPPLTLLLLPLPTLLLLRPNQPRMAQPSNCCLFRKADLRVGFFMPAGSERQLER
jgi:hypothetical protein